MPWKNPDSPTPDSWSTFAAAFTTEGVTGSTRFWGWHSGRGVRVDAEPLPPPWRRMREQATHGGRHMGRFRRLILVAFVVLPAGVVVVAGVLIHRRVTT